MDDLEWGRVKPAPRGSAVAKLEKDLNIKLLESYKFCLANFHCGHPDPDEIDVEGKGTTFIAWFLSADDKNPKSGYILGRLRTLGSDIPDRIIPFARDPGGNLFCFDYRSSETPSVVFWDHEAASTNSSIFHVAESFEAFLAALS